jgi:hypothetical protein
LFLKFRLSGRVLRNPVFTLPFLAAPPVRHRQRKKDRENYRRVAAERLPGKKSKEGVRGEKTST